MPRWPEFLFITCQVGAERPLKAELAREQPELRFAYSRPGFVTYKIPPDDRLASELSLRSVFARAYGYTLGQAKGELVRDLAQQVWQAAGDRQFQAVHVWSRTPNLPGEDDSEHDLVAQATRALLDTVPTSQCDQLTAEQFNTPAGRGQMVLDCVLVEPNHWWVGCHRADCFSARWPGGAMPIKSPRECVSRAYFKMEEGLRWSDLPVQPGEACIELGSSPGGASQCLLSHDLQVYGLDPAEMDARVLDHPRFQHWRMRAEEVRIRQLCKHKIRWLMADMNVVPDQTLRRVERIVTHPEVHIRGLLLMLKLRDWQLAERIPEYLDQIRGWGYRDVRARQLVFNRREICVAALKNRALRRVVGKS